MIPLRYPTYMHGEKVIGLTEVGFTPNKKRGQILGKEKGWIKSSKPSLEFIKLLGFYNGSIDRSLSRPVSYNPDIVLHYTSVPEDFYNHLLSEEEFIKSGNFLKRNEVKDLFFLALETRDNTLIKTVIDNCNRQNSQEGPFCGKLIEMLILSELKLASNQVGIRFSNNDNVPYLRTNGEIVDSEIDGLLFSDKVSTFIDLTSRLRRRSHLVIRDVWT
jgi:hypothetical protein